jgi:hypothetical protein
MSLCHAFYHYFFQRSFRPWQPYVNHQRMASRIGPHDLFHSAYCGIAHESFHIDASPFAVKPNRFHRRVETDFVAELEAVGKGFLRAVDAYIHTVELMGIHTCRNLKVEGVDLFGGTRHSTATALGEHFFRQEIMTAGSMHKTNKAALLYIQAEKNKSILVYQKVREMQGNVVQSGK